ncbi:MAG: histidine kinase [Flavisolibacter sp.]|nr:histidine kinase [Flavisolibacter sp.]
MKEFMDKPVHFNKIEFWAATTIFVFVVFFHIAAASTNDIANAWTPNKQLFDKANVPFHYYQYYFIPQLVRYIILYLAFLLLNFRVVPKLIKKEGLFINIMLAILVYVIVGVVLGITDTYLKYYLFDNYRTEQEAYTVLFQNSFLHAAWLLFIFGFYSVIRYLSLFLLSHAEAIQSKYKFITPGGLAAFIIWMVIMFLLLTNNEDRGLKAGWAIVIPTAIFLYLYSFHSLIPKSLSKKYPFRSYVGKVLIVLAISFLPVWLLAALLVNHAEAGGAFSFFNVAFQLFITVPLTWLLFRRHMKGNEEIYSLKKELGRSHASFDFLRSQINPHFLFNALNTIYGTAIQEGAERTSEGIEKLGDMMRFMLQENMQEKISLAREIDYLNNYISLQRLRTDPNPIVKIESEIEQPVQPTQIAPMLLIPFVENAFKHGISLREPSHIKITLEVKDHTLYFDVYNSKHNKRENDPEKYKSGIGLSNVKQRLQLLYPGKHELIIRETGKDFFVHLTIRLT